MTITLELKPEVEQRAQAEAAARGVSVEEYLQEAIEQITAPRPMSGAELLAIWERDGVLGAWADRDDIQDSAAYARELRRRAESRERG